MPENYLPVFPAHVLPDPPLFLEAAVDVTNDPVEFVRPVYLSAAIVPGVLTMKNRCRDFKNEFPKQFFTMVQKVTSLSRDLNTGPADYKSAALPAKPTEAPYTIDREG